MTPDPRPFIYPIYRKNSFLKILCLGKYEFSVRLLIDPREKLSEVACSLMTFTVRNFGAQRCIIIVIMSEVYHCAVLSLVVKFTG